MIHAPNESVIYRLSSGMNNTLYFLWRKERIWKRKRNSRIYGNLEISEFYKYLSFFSNLRLYDTYREREINKKKKKKRIFSINFIKLAYCRIISCMKKRFLGLSTASKNDHDNYITYFYSLKAKYATVSKKEWIILAHLIFSVRHIPTTEALYLWLVPKPLELRKGESTGSFHRIIRLFTPYITHYIFSQSWKKTFNAAKSYVSFFFTFKSNFRKPCWSVALAAIQRISTCNYTALKFTML